MKSTYNYIKENVARVVNQYLNEDRNEKYSLTVEFENVNKFVISDPSYALTEEDYDSWGEKNNYNAGQLYKEIGNDDDYDEYTLGIIHRTYYGDGGYDSTSGKNYGVDVGAIGIFNYDYCDQKEVKELSRLLRVITLKDKKNYKVTLEYDNGTFKFYINKKLIETIYTK